MRGIPRQAVHEGCKILGTEKTAKDIAMTNSICFWNGDMYGVDAAKEGAKEYYKSIFELYASWGVDFIKCDDICRELPQAEAELKLLSEALRGCGRDMVLSLSPGPAILEKVDVYKETADMWRITDDFWDDWKALYNMFERCEKWCIHTGAGFWPDADMLPVGAIRQDYDENDRTRFTEDEQRTMMTLWCIFRSPLMIGGEMTKNDDFTLNLLTSRQILDMSENARHAHQVFRKKVKDTEVVLWTAVNAKGGQYVAVFNIGEEKLDMTIALEELEIYEPSDVKNLWNGEKKEAVTKLDVSLPPHGCSAFLVG